MASWRDNCPKNKIKKWEMAVATGQISHLNCTTNRVGRFVARFVSVGELIRVI